jgi:signal transduction histidine kinase/CheY-like chemotaxis protein
MNDQSNFFSQASYLYKHTISCALVTALLMTIVSMVIWDYCDTNLIIGWLILGGIKLTSHFIFNQFIEKKYKTINNKNLSKFIILISALYTSVLWCYCSLFFVTDNKPEMMIFLIATIISIISTMLPILSTYLPAFYIFSIPIFVSLIYRFYSMDMISPALSISLCIMTSTITSFHCHRSINQNLKIAEKNKNLANKQLKKRYIAEQNSKKAIKESIHKSKIIGTASHDLKQPLHAMGLCLEALEINISKPMEGRIILEKIRLCHSNLIDMFTSTMEFINLDLNHIPIKRNNFYLKDAITPLIKEFEIEASKKGISFLYTASDIIVFSEINLIRRIIRNLLSNAVKYSNSGSVKISTQVIKNMVVLKISDNGIGISKDKISSIFEYSTQLNNPDNNIEHGSGLGLAIVKKISDILNLNISVKSKQLIGTKFILHLPLSINNYGSLPYEKVTPNNKTVLIIESDLVKLKNLSSMLKITNCTPLLARSLNEALEIVTNRNSKLDLIISNYCLNSDENGIDAIRQLKSIAYSETPTIIITDNTCPKLADKIRSFKSILMYQPISMVLLTNALNRCRQA